MSPIAQSSLETTLRHEPLAALPVLFAAGLATSLTPCVYPMIPITAGILGGAGATGISRRRTALLTGAYAGGHHAHSHGDDGSHDHDHEHEHEHGHMHAGHGCGHGHEHQH